jgi:primosomal protein N' (replication factor Y)
MQALALSDRDAFLAIERDVREELQLPPFGRMAALILSAPDAETAVTFGQQIARAAPNGENITVYGPAPAPIGILRGRHRFRFLITAPKQVDLSAYMAAWLSRLKLQAALRLSADIDPYSFL